MAIGANLFLIPPGPTASISSTKTLSPLLALVIKLFNWVVIADPTPATPSAFPLLEHKVLRILSR